VIRKACRRCGSANCQNPAHAAQPRRNVPSRQRRRILIRDGFRCQDCGKPVVDDQGDLDYAVIGHRLARVEGGTMDDANLYTSCEPCNLARGALPL